MNSTDNTLTDEKIEWIKSRRSVGNLKEPAPNNDEIKYAIECAMSAPDHKKLQPWRFIVTTGEGQERLSDAFLQAGQVKAKRDEQILDEKQLERIKKMPLRAPVIITVVTKMSYHEKVPSFEQLLSTGACIQNLTLALQSMGYASIWRTGLLCNEMPIKEYFNVSDDDYVAGFIYIGTNKVISKEMSCRRADIDTVNFITFDD